jgi:gliding motility-associated-like protein
LAPLLPARSNNGITGTWQPAIVSNTTSANYTFTPNAGQCATVFVLPVVVNPAVINGLCKIIIPNSFTPNDDGTNDVFRVIGNLSVNSFTFNIYNRYGELIFNTTEKSKGWDGRFKGVLQPIGVYLYMVSYKETVSNKLVNFHGTVSLIQ